jgi:hypothetical protein
MGVAQRNAESAQTLWSFLSVVRNRLRLSSSTLLSSPPQVPSPSAVCNEREIDISHSAINLYDNMLLARAQHAQQGTTS